MVAAISQTINWKQMLGKSETIVEATINQIKNNNNNNTGTQNEQHFYLKGSPKKRKEKINKKKCKTTNNIVSTMQKNICL